MYSTSTYSSAILFLPGSTFKHLRKISHGNQPSKFYHNSQIETARSYSGLMILFLRDIDQEISNERD